MLYQLSFEWNHNFATRTEQEVQSSSISYETSHFVPQLNMVFIKSRVFRKTSVALVKHPAQTQSCWFVFWNSNPNELLFWFTFLCDCGDDLCGQQHFFFLKEAICQPKTFLTLWNRKLLKIFDILKRYSMSFLKCYLVSNRVWVEPSKLRIKLETKTEM